MLYAVQANSVFEARLWEADPDAASGECRCVFGIKPAARVPRGLAFAMP